MKQNHFLQFLALVLLVFWGSCAPPWRGEEGNYPIVALAFEDTVTHTRVPWASLGITALENVEHQRSLPIGNAFAQPGMNYDSRLNETEWLLLPIDKADTIQTFVLHHANGTDTIQFRLRPDYGVDDDAEWDQTSFYLNLKDHTFAALGRYYQDEFLGQRQNTYYHPQIMKWLWVAL